MANRGFALKRAAGGNSGTGTRFDALCEEVRRYRPESDVDLLRRAYEFSALHHSDQIRASGEPYLSHPLEVAHLLAGMRLDVTSVCGGLLHDVLEDTGVDLPAMENAFGPHVTRLVAGVTKISRLEFSGQETAQAENLRKMLLAMVDDVRVVLIKLADRLHNMRTLHYLPVEKRERVARETLDIYAPIAHRLGMGRMRGELEDLAFTYLEPDACQRIRAHLQERQELNRRFLTEVQHTLTEELKKHSVPGRIEGRIKGLYSIHQKISRQGVSPSQIFDLLAVRVITDTVTNCYAALGIVHQLWRPVPSRFKDYIAMPRSNLYQSLHTAVVHPSGHPFEAQIRTQEMHVVAEQGIAAHWRYKDGGSITPEDQERVAWLRSLIDWAREVQDPSEFLSTLKGDLYFDEVYVFSPKGKVIVLPRHATPVDFAYAIHTEVGHQCVGAKVNGRIVPLRYRLQSGEIVEILTNARHAPSRDWMSFVRTTRARNKIQHWIRSQQRRQAAELGRKLLEKEARRFQVNLKKVAASEWEAVARAFGCRRAEELLTRLGFGKYSPRQVLSRLTAQPLPERPAKGGPRLGAGLRQTMRRMFRLRGETLSLRGQELLMYRARCCNPIHGEPVVGYITRGRGIAVHAKDCPNVQNLLYDLERRIQVEWADGDGEAYPVRVAVRSSDRPGLLREISGVIAEQGCNIRTAEAHTDASGGYSLIDLIFDVAERKQLDRILGALKNVSGVHEVTRVLRV